VLQAALKLADKGGIEALSMRKLARELGVEAMSLYNHVANKHDLVAGILDLVASEFELPADGADWKTSMRQSAISAHDALSRHPWAAGVWMSTPEPSPLRLRYADALLRSFREAGFSKDLTYHAFHIVQNHILGVALQESSFPFDREELKELAATFLRDFPADEYPDLAEHTRQHMEPDEQHEGAFAFGLDLILDGLERRRDET
jgi:AcrR family transcriptional regulator